MARYSKEELDQTKDTDKYEKQKSRTWNQVISFLQRTYPEYNDRKEDLPEANGIVLATVFAGALTPFLTFLCYAGAGLGLVAMLGSFTFNTIKVYKVSIGTLQGGMTVMGSSRRIISSKMAWSNPMTVVYNAEPDEYNLVNFIEKVNARIALLQERGSFAFDSCLEDLEEYDE
jgi:hypothetical protein